MMDSPRIHRVSHTMNKPTLQQRRAQSRRDKARNVRLAQPRAATKNAPLARSQSFARPAARIKAGSDTLTISHTEVIGTLNGTQSFGVQSFLINPGLSSVLPWGSQIASAYDYYIPKTVTITMKPILPATEPGMVFMYADSDVFDSGPSSMITASGNAHFKSASVWAGMSQTYPASFFHTRRMFKVRSTAYPPETSADDYDCARIWVGSEGLTANKSMGYLTMTYVFELRNPTVRETGLSSVKLALRDTTDINTIAGTSDLDLTKFIVTEVKGRPPVDLEVGQIPTTTGLPLTKAFNGTISAVLNDLLHFNHTANRTLTDQDAIAFTHRFEGETTTKSGSNLNKFVDALASGFYEDISSVDDFFINAKRGAVIQPRLTENAVKTYRGTADQTKNTIDYLFNLATNTATYL